jgi:MtN3 and saliva related transmembrane protein
MEPADLFATIAAVCTTVAFIPQAVKILQTKDTAAISLSMYLIFTTGVACWFVFGVLIESWPVIIANIITFGLAASILYCKIRYK